MKGKTMYDNVLEQLYGIPLAKRRRMEIPCADGMLYNMHITYVYEKLLCCIFNSFINICISYNLFILTLEFVNNIRNHIKNLSYSILILNINKLGCTILNN